MQRTLLLLMGLIVASACSRAPAPESGPAPAEVPAPPPAPQLEPVGMYDIAVSFEGQTLEAVMEITGSPGSYTGSIAPEGLDRATITSVEVDGMTMQVTADIPDGSVATFELNFEGSSFTGTVSVMGQTGTVTGTKRS